MRGETTGGGGTEEGLRERQRTLSGQEESLNGNKQTAKKTNAEKDNNNKIDRKIYER